VKKLIIAAVAASMLATPVLAAPYQNQDHRGRVEQRVDHRGPQVQYRHWNKGDRFDHRQAYNYRVISSPRHYHLRPAPRGYRWVQSGNDAVLIGITTGIVASVLANAIR
jgi:Ni/Co efflux regulator RcnB